MYKTQLATHIDSNRIITDVQKLNSYFEDNNPVMDDSTLLAVRPENKTEVRNIVKLANEQLMPVIPVSSGSIAPYEDGLIPQKGVIVDFSRMNRILKIDSTSRYVMIEPGVTFETLIPELKRHGLRLNLPFLPRPFKSVLTSYLEREPGMIPKYQYDFIDPLLTLEVVYGTGDDFRTGSASGPGDLNTLKSDKVNPWGPGSVDYFRFVSGAQGTMGLVTWATLKTEVLPSVQKLFYIPVHDIAKLTAPMNMLLRRRIVDECLAVNNVTLAAVLAKNWPGDFERLKLLLPPWTIITCISGYKRRPEERIALQEKHLHECCKEVKLTPQKQLIENDCLEDDVLNLLQSGSNGMPYWKYRQKRNCFDIFFLTTLSKVAGFITTMEKRSAEYDFQKENLGGIVQPMVQGRGCHCEFTLLYDGNNPEELSKTKALFLDASKTLFDQGAFFSRPYGPWAKMVYDKYPEGVEILKKIKNIFDPNGILNPNRLCY